MGTEAYDIMVKYLERPRAVALPHPALKRKG
jgi:hypothetical protein